MGGDACPHLEHGPSGMGTTDFTEMSMVSSNLHEHGQNINNFWNHVRFKTHVKHFFKTHISVRCCRAPGGLFERSARPGIFIDLFRHRHSRIAAPSLRCHD